MRGEFPLFLFVYLPKNRKSHVFLWCWLFATEAIKDNTPAHCHTPHFLHHDDLSRFYPIFILLLAGDEVIHIKGRNTDPLLNRHRWSPSQKEWLPDSTVPSKHRLANAGAIKGTGHLTGSTRPKSHPPVPHVPRSVAGDEGDGMLAGLGRVL